MSVSPSRVSAVLPAWKVRTRVTTPGVPALTLDEVKAHLRITNNASDAYLTQLILVAQNLAEEYTGRYFTTTIVEGQADDPGTLQAWWDGVIQASGNALSASPRIIEIPRPPLVSVQTFEYVGLDGVAYLVPATSYIVDISSPDRIGRLALKYFATTPTSPQEILALKLAYAAGYGAPADVPPMIKQGLLMLVSFLYDNRGECADGGAGVIALSGAQVFLDIVRLRRV